MKIAIIGAGNVGQALARSLSSKGHTIVYGVRDPNSPKSAGLTLGSRIQTASVPEAVQLGDIVFLATPWKATQEAIAAAGNLEGRILVDCTNPLTGDLAALEIGHTTSGGEQVAIWAKGARVCKAFNQTGAENLGNCRFGRAKPVMFVCGNDRDANRIVMHLADEIGFEAVDAGPLSMARLLEPLALLWISAAFKMGLGRTFAFGLLRRG